MSDTTEIRIKENGDETHESWVLIRANQVSATPGQHLFDSEIAHQHYITVTVTRCTRRRDLNHDSLFNTEVLIELGMSQAQWGAFVSSFGQRGVPATLQYLTGVGQVARAPEQSRFAVSHQEVRDSGVKALEQISASYQTVMDAFESGGKRAMRDALRRLGWSIDNAPGNMEFAASSLTEHVENVVTKARADIEGMVLSAMEQGALTEPVALFELDSGDVQDADPVEDSDA